MATEKVTEGDEVTVIQGNSSKANYFVYGGITGKRVIPSPPVTHPMPLASLQPTSPAPWPTHGMGITSLSSPNDHAGIRIWERPERSRNSRRGLQHQSSTLQWSWSPGTTNTVLGFPALVYETSTMSRCTGKERDAESGLDYFGARYYGATMGRWLSPDWGEKPMAIPYAQYDDPQSLNLYGYVRNNPITGIDADGHCWMASVCELISWAANAIGRDGGVKQAAKNVGIGIAKGTGSFVHSTTTMMAAGSGNPGSAVATLMQPAPAALAPSNQTQAEASVATQLTLTVASAVVPAAMEGAAARAAASETPAVGETVFRVWGGESGPYGKSWTPVNPDAVPGFADAAGLPKGNTGTQMTTGTLTDTTGVQTRQALPLNGNKGGLPEYTVPDPKNQIKINSIRENPPPTQN